MTTQCKNTLNKSAGIAPAACEIEWSELLHVTGDHSQVYCLTKAQLQDIVVEEQFVSRPIKELTDTYTQSNETILAMKQLTLKTLKEEKLIPPLKPSGNNNSLAIYKAEWTLAYERYQRQVKRERRISGDCHVIKSELDHSFLSKPTRNFYSRYLASLQQTQSGLSQNLRNLELTSKQKKQRYDGEVSRIKQLQVAVESEVEFRVAQQSTPPLSAQTLKQLREKAYELSVDTGLSNYVIEDELKNITDIEIKLSNLEKHIESNESQMTELRVLSFLQGGGWFERIYKKTDTALNDYEKAQKELYQTKYKLGSEKLDFYTSIKERSPVEAPTQMATMHYAHQLIEIKRTGSQGFSYIRRDSLDQLKKNWQKLSMDDIKKSLKPTQKGLKGAAQQAGKALSKNIGIKLKFANWQSKEDNFFNQLNKELFKASLNGDVPPKDKQFDASAEAQLFRFSAGAELAGEYDVKNGRVHIGAESQVSYNLMQASVSTKVCLPSEAGYELKLSYQGDTGELKALDCGYFRAKFDLTLQGSVGACAMLSTKVRIDTKPGELSVGGDINGNVFAGGMLKNEAAVSVEWAKPNGGGSNSRLGKSLVPNYQALVEVKPSISVAFGIGAGFDFKIEYLDGSFVLKLSAQLVCGPGGAGGVAVVLSVDKIVELIEFVRDALEKSDFRFLEWVSKEAFEVISKFTELHLSFEHTLEGLAELSETVITDMWRDISVDQKAVKNECRRIVTEPVRAKVATPLSKARVLNRISNTYIFEANSFSLDDDELQAEACMKLLTCIQSEREFIEILRLMGMNKGKGDSVMFLSNFRKLFDHLLYQSKQRDKAYYWLEHIARSSYESR